MSTQKSFHLMDPDLKKHIDLFPVGVVLTKEMLPFIREQTKAQMKPVPEELPVVVTETFIPGPPDAPDVRVILIQPKERSAPSPGYLDIHGGGMILGTADAGNYENAMLCAELGCTVVSVDYRLAPETPSPGPIEDCYAALRWMHANALELGIDRDKIAIGGGSAGGGLAASLALLARDRGEVNILFQRLQFPMLDDRTCIADSNPYNGEYVWTRECNTLGWKSLLGHDPGAEGVSPYAAPARAEDLTGLPATFISVGAIDLFAEECIEYAKRLIRAGVPTELHVYPGAPHGFHFVEDARVTIAEKRDVLEALRRAFYG
ncbi:alpha/beta hydrolase [Paenibacillus sp.]|uniref:alpha/beta hydrolase n=1 Tax=Paenibacillus sp. TaxID=58172 RepID=UPI002D600974|nr:alpha/beta hydrolase [Paenibacillus sp.]HZG87983.1 alpha/beta hydrolase [Paenibacillus sp.]